MGVGICQETQQKTKPNRTNEAHGAFNRRTNLNWRTADGGVNQGSFQTARPSAKESTVFTSISSEQAQGTKQRRKQWPSAERQLQVESQRQKQTGLQCA